MACRLVFAAAAFCAALCAVPACSSSTPASPAPSPAGEPDASTLTEETDAGADAPAPEDACGPVPKSKCKSKNAGNTGSVVRGIARFDASRFAGSSKKPKLQIWMHHTFILYDDEAKLGGHPHAYKTVDVDLAKGEARFAIDMCELGRAMWSEENCGPFNLVLMLDEDGDNDPDNGQTAVIPTKGELVKMTQVEISCHKPSPCIEVTLDCTNGEACTTFEPVKSCACAKDACTSESKFCK
jgi:hypothetical protein